MPVPKGEVEIEKYGTIADASTPLASDWPNGKHLMDMIKRLHAGDDDDPEYWQVCARWALLRKYDLLDTPGAYLQRDDGTNKLIFYTEAMEMIQAKWNECRSLMKDGDLGEFFQTSLSNQRPLQWCLMECGPASQFKLHAHPNLELVYCVRGELHEVRMNGDPVGVSNDAKGPSLIDSQRSWSFSTLRQGNWLVNELGSIHKSFTSTNGEGCTLLTLWSGGHADILPDQEPTSFNVQAAVDQMDEKICQCAHGEILQETFLPDSEKCINGKVDV